MANPTKDTATIYAAYYTQLLSFAMNFVAEEDAKDIVGDVFVRICDRASQGLGIEGKSFYYMMVRNMCLDKLRHSKVHQNYILLAQATPVPMDEEDVKEYEDKIQRLSAVIEDLGEPDKTILKCCYFKKMTYQQTADQLGLSLNSIKKHMLKIFRNLRKVLKVDNDEV